MSVSTSPSQAEGLGIMAFRRFIEDRRGSGAIEFAILIPILIMVYVCAFEISIAISVSRKVGRASATVSDLLTKSDTTTGDILDSMKNVTRSVLASYPATDLIMEITGITVDAEGKATVAWSRNQAKERPYKVGDVVTMPSGMGAKDTFFVRTTLKLPYKVLLFAPNLESRWNTLGLEKTSYFRLRTGTAITCSGC